MFHSQTLGGEANGPWGLAGSPMRWLMQAGLGFDGCMRWLMQLPTTYLF